MTDQTYDVVVIGAGPVGENVADYAIRGSKMTALLIERELVGGECSYYACMPSKALLRPLEVRAAATQLGGLPAEIPLDVPALLERRNVWVSRYDDAGQVGWAKGVGIEVARGTAKLIGERRLVISGSGTHREVVAREAVVVATGSEPVIPGMYSTLHPWTSRDATGVVEVPSSLAIIGGGVVAVEAARWLAAIGTAVTLLVRGDRVLERFEAFASEQVAEGLRGLGVDIRFGAHVTSAARLDAADTGLGRVHGGAVRLELDGRAEEFAEVLVATGRRPRTNDLGLGAVDLTPEQFTDPAARPGWLYAVGDASGDPALTHWGKYVARLVGGDIAARAAGRPVPQRPADVPVPQVVFTEPQVASTGLTEEQASSQGLEVVAVDAPMTGAAGYGLLRDDASGQARLVFESGTGRLVGATFVGQEVAELVHAATIAVVGRMTAEQLWHAVPSYPTASEIWLRLLDAYRER